MSKKTDKAEWIAVEIDCETGDRVYREMTAEEIAQRETEHAKGLERARQQAERETQRKEALARARADPVLADLLTALGLSECESCSRM